MGSLNFKRKLMVLKTFTFTAAAAMSAALLAAPPSSSAVWAATEVRPCKSPSKAQPGALVAAASFVERYVPAAPAKAPQFVWPMTTMSRLPSFPTQNSKLPTKLPSACVQVLPALRSTNRSPGAASKTASTGARESAQPMIAACGAWPWSTKAFRMSCVAAGARGAPVVYLWLPAFSSSNAFCGGTAGDLVVRTVPGVDSLIKIEGGSAVLDSIKDDWSGEGPRNFTLPVSSS
mmetsp:Transcript_38338/g.68560  ORF Transcript_38338/g.68560 Transcript_38338/m.68560 type:complete len:233 (+) Transcript_38338:972-1670(+)